jgi:hypothetical protein
MDSTSLKNKDITDATSTKNPPKKAHSISNKIFVVIDDRLVKSLKIDENTWFDQEHNEDGILLKIHHLMFREKKNAE